MAEAKKAGGTEQGDYSWALFHTETAAPLLLLGIAVTGGL